MKKIEDYLHLYCGHKAMVSDCDPPQETPVTIIGLTDDNFTAVVKCIEEPGEYINYFSSSLKPILRPLSDMTEQEALDGPGSSLRDKWVIHQANVTDLRDALWSPLQVKYLLSKGFDLFGLIESGLAIDKTKKHH